MPTSQQPLEQRIKALIRKGGPISFAQFMEMALFASEGGYYAQPNAIGAQGDFYTSPTAHPVFGALLALQLQEFWHLLGEPRPFYAIEAGAGSGLLASSILAYLPHLDQAFQRSLRYLMLERYGTGMHILRDTLSSLPSHPFLPEGLMTQQVSLRHLVGCILANELLDAFPVHRVTVRGGKLRELMVGLQDDSFVEVLSDPSSPELEHYLRQESIGLQEGWVAEISLEAPRWAARTAQALERGALLIFDYGDTADLLYSEQRRRGTLMCYYKHTACENPYLRVGQQDITAHLDFTSLRRAGEAHGLETLGMVTQRDFLLNLGLEQFLRALAYRNLPQHEYYPNLMGMRDLINPEGLGKFKVLLQAKGIPAPLVSGLTSQSLVQAALAEQGPSLAVPLLSQQHMPLLSGKYPHMATSWDHLLSDPEDASSH